MKSTHYVIKNSPIGLTDTYVNRGQGNSFYLFVPRPLKTSQAFKNRAAIAKRFFRPGISSSKGWIPLEKPGKTTLKTQLPSFEFWVTSSRGWAAGQCQARQPNGWGWGWHWHPAVFHRYINYINQAFFSSKTQRKIPCVFRLKKSGQNLLPLKH